MSGHPPVDEDLKKPSRARLVGPGLALFLLAGTGLYALVTRMGPVAPPPPGSGQAPGAAVLTPGARGASTPAARPGAQPATATGQAAQAPAPAGPAAQDPAQAAQEQREAARQTARQFRAGRFNAFFRKEVFLEELAKEGTGPKIAALKDELADLSALQQLPAGTQFMETKPEPVLERMAMIDLLFELAPTDPAARDAMTSLALSPIDRELSDSVKKGLVGEKYDLLFRLAQVDRRLAVDTYTKLESQKLKNLLLEALVAGLAESGASPDEVRQIVAHL
ncbi:hypothetical protein [Pyxidicoccus sp. MSG2]|uniref:hypothetical protein n=1 Tax=Pyxidicoccus sp. MSG2 TaxID=2996790 RepID=UPI00226FFC56|nr:hypothetical protein [Pyxidicoccus sp. MSG2]MCY1019998.1 hypothetical protein [Pyxidicoccus sp. MSG2]